MPAPPVNLYPDESKMARLRRELRNPSMLTIGIIVVAILAIPAALLVPSWVQTTRDSLQRRADADAQREQIIVSASVLVPSQIVPWMLNEIEQMEGATNPSTWNEVDFTQGPCNATNLSQLPVGKYADAIATACADLNETQTEYARTCVSVATCAIPEEGLAELAAVRTGLVDAFSDAGFVLEYQDEEEDVGP